jgi:hypothetical protein
VTRYFIYRYIYEKLDGLAVNYKNVMLPSRK